MAETLSLSRVIKPQSGWYRGDFHAHTNFSDGYYAPPELVEVARAAGLDFFTITDHNTINAYTHFGTPPDLAIIPGLEVTVKTGHFNVFGIEDRPNWLGSLDRARLSGEFDTMTKLMRHTAKAGLLNAINHPLLEPWAWLDQATDLRFVHCLEIWNDPSWPDNRQANPQAVVLWTRWLNAGYRITAIGGSDFHRPEPKPGENKPAERLGLPATYVYSAELSGAAILEGLRQRRAYVSMGPQVTFQVKAGEKSYEIGGDLGESRGTVTFQATVGSCPALGQAQIVANGQVVAALPVEPQGTELTYQTMLDPTRAAWHRFEVWDTTGQMLALTNPIFSGPAHPPVSHTYGDFLE